MSVLFQSFCHDEMPLALIKQRLTRVTHNTFRHCRARFFTLIGKFLETAVYLDLSMCKVNEKIRLSVGWTVPGLFDRHSEHSIHPLRF